MIKETKVKINPNELCPCNSGEIYNKCCIKDEFYNLGQNYKGDNIIFNKSKVHRIYDDIANIGINNIFSLKDDEFISISKGEELLKKVYEKVDEGISEYEKYSPCKKGCGKCCSLYLECTAIEAEIIRRYLVKNKTKEELDVLQNKIRENLKILPTISNPNEVDKEAKDKMILDYLHKNISCIFLNEEGECSLYSIRPLVCRSFIVFSDSEKCKSKEEIVKPNLPPAYIGKLVVDGIASKVGRYKSITFNGDKGLKEPLRRPILQWFKDGFHDINRNLE